MRTRSTAPGCAPFLSAAAHIQQLDRVLRRLRPRRRGGCRASCYGGPHYRCVTDVSLQPELSAEPGAVRLSWLDAPDRTLPEGALGGRIDFDKFEVDTYSVGRSDNFGRFVMVGCVREGTEFVDRTVRAGVHYRYRVRAHYGGPHHIYRGKSISRTFLEMSVWLPTSTRSRPGRARTWRSWRRRRLSRRSTSAATRRRIGRRAGRRAASRRGLWRRWCSR